MGPPALQTPTLKSLHSPPRPVPLRGLTLTGGTDPIPRTLPGLLSVGRNQACQLPPSAGLRRQLQGLVRTWKRNLQPIAAER